MKTLAPAPGDRVQEILFIDDDSRVRRGVDRLFRQSRVPWACTFAASVDEALDILTEREVDAVVSDIRMPGRDGFELLNHIRGNPPWIDLPVVILTGLDNPGLKSKALDLGATDLLSKPVSPDELLARIRSVLHIKRCQDTIKLHNSHLEELVRQRTEMLEATRLDMIWRLARAAEFRSRETGNHVIRVGYSARILAERLGMDRDFTDTLFLTSPLHDLGKIAVPDAILDKPGPLTPEEWRVMQGHCLIGRDLLTARFSAPGHLPAAGRLSLTRILDQESNPFLQMAADIAAGHHEQFNGGGYPGGRKGAEIPLSARIVTVCDIYDALRSPRAYKPAISHEETMAIMRWEDTCLNRFDPAIFAVFEQSLDDFQEIHHTYGEDWTELEADEGKREKKIDSTN